VEYGNVEFKSDNRGTFLTLKSAALKKNDQIKALEFHTQEYQSHYEKFRILYSINNNPTKKPTVILFLKIVVKS
jgi:hypothetical protein